jgi:hypothetical protein
MEVKLPPASTARDLAHHAQRIFLEFTFPLAVLVRVITTAEMFGTSLFSIIAVRHLWSLVDLAI